MVNNMEKNTDNTDDLINLYLEAIDNRDVAEIENLYNKDSKNRDLVYEVYDKSLLTYERLDFIANNCNKYLNFSNSLLKR